MDREGEIVLSGTWLYDGVVETEVEIRRMTILYGSGDYEDPPEIQYDNEVENYQIRFGMPGTPGEFSVSGWPEFSIEKAKATAERLVKQKIRWQLSCPI
jgi:hypothetical protein